jgi:DNA-directed RNA polymerase specialized sigma24 family protein
MTILPIGYAGTGGNMSSGAATACPLPMPDPPLDRRALRIMMGTAAYHASRVARTMVLSETDREDVEQDILLALIERRRFFDPARGAWSYFADRVARQVTQAIADRIGHQRRLRGDVFDAADPDHEPAISRDAAIEPRSDPIEQAWLTSALARFCAVLPNELAIVTVLALREDGDLAEAQRQSGLSTSEFYRRLREIRCRMICVGIVRNPTGFRAGASPSSVNTSQDLLGKTHPSIATKGTRARQGGHAQK